MPYPFHETILIISEQAEVSISNKITIYLFRYIIVNINLNRHIHQTFLYRFYIRSGGFLLFSIYNIFAMKDDASIFWENVKKEIKSQNTTQEWVASNSGISFSTFQGWILKGMFPRLNEAIRIAGSLNTSVEYLASGSVADNRKAIETIRRHLPQIQEHLDFIKQAIREIQ